MLSKSIRVLDLDGSVIRQKNLLSAYQTQVIDLKDLGPRVRLWTDRRLRADLEERIGKSAENKLTFIGSGDFHQVSEVLLSRFKEPLVLINFDFHPDWSILPPRYGCGAWVARALEKKNVMKCVLLGVSSADISTFHIQTDIQMGNLDAFRDDRIEIYPYSHPPTSVFFAEVPDNISFSVRRDPFVSKISWNGLKDKNLTEFTLHLARRLPVKQVYISIDKDCLKREDALTNWEEGRLSLDDLLMMLKIFRDNLDIVGADVTGEYSDIRIKGLFKTFASYIDHPRDYSARPARQPDIDRVNEKTNLRIARILTEAVSG